MQSSGRPAALAAALIHCESSFTLRARPVEVAQAALKGRQDWYDKREGEAERKRLAALPALILRAGGAQGLADDKGYVLRLDEYLLEVLPPPAQRRVRRVREAMEAMELAALAAGSELYSAAG